MSRRRRLGVPLSVEALAAATETRAAGGAATRVGAFACHRITLPSVPRIRAAPVGHAGIYVGVVGAGNRSGRFVGNRARGSNQPNSIAPIASFGSNGPVLGVRGVYKSYGAVV